MSTKLKNLLAKKTFWAVIIVVMLIFAYFSFQITKGNDNIPKYVTGAVTKGAVIVSVSGTGQVAVTSQVDIKPKVSGQVTAVKIVNGQNIKAGTVIAQIDPKEANRSVRDAQLNLEEAKLAMQKLQKPTDNYTIAQAQSDLDQAKLDLVKLQKPPTDYDLLTAKNSITQSARNFTQAQDNLTKYNYSNAQTLQKTLDDGYTAVSNAYLDLPNLMKDEYSVQFNLKDDPQDHLSEFRAILGANSVFITSMINDDKNASVLLKNSFANFKTVGRTADQAVQMKLIEDALITSKAVYQSLESTKNVLDEINNRDIKYNIGSETAATLLIKMENALMTINKDIPVLQSAKDTFDNTTQNAPLELKSLQAAIDAAAEQIKEKQANLDKLQAGPTQEDIIAAQEKIKQRQQALDKLAEGADALDIKSQELAIKQRENSLMDTKQTLADYTVVAPFDAIISKVAVNKGDTISSGTVVATAITKQVVAQISLNEVDVSKIKVGDKSTLTFDALSDLTISGKVEEIDLLGTVSQGVVTYNVKIAFDTQDERIKSGMSVSAAIITDVHPDVLIVANSALKNQGDLHYVEILANPSPTDKNSSEEMTVTSKSPPMQQMVEIGLSNDTSTEILNGLQEGDRIVLKTVTTTQKAATTGSSALRLGGTSGGGLAGGFGGGAGNRAVGG